MRMQKTLQKIKDIAYKKGYEAAMNKLIKDHTNDNHFFPTGVLAEVLGRMSGNIQSMRNDDLDSLDKKFYADAFEDLYNDLKDLREFMFDKDLYMVRIQADK